MELPPNATNGNRALVCFALSLPLTTAIIIAIINGPVAIARIGIPLYVLAIGLVIAGLIFGIRAYQLKEEKFRYQFSLIFNGVMLFSLVMMVALLFFARAQGM